MRVLVLASGGKDSAFAHWWAALQGWDVVGLITARVSSDDSWMFQVAASGIAGVQAAATGVPWRPVPVSGEAEVEVGELELGLRVLCPVEWGEVDGLAGEAGWAVASWPTDWSAGAAPRLLEASMLDGPVDALVSGALASEYQRTQLDRLGERLGVRTFAPLWHHARGSHLRHVVGLGFDVRMALVAADGLDASWLGRRLDSGALEELDTLAARHRFDVAGEGGEFETVVLDGPGWCSTIGVEAQVEAGPSRARWWVRRAWLETDIQDGSPAAGDEQHGH